MCTEEFGIHYGIILVANKETTKEILNMIQNDYMEAFDYKTMEKLNRNLEMVELAAEGH